MVEETITSVWLPATLLQLRILAVTSNKGQLCGIKSQGYSGRDTRNELPPLYRPLVNSCLGCAGQALQKPWDSPAYTAINITKRKKRIGCARGANDL